MLLLSRRSIIFFFPYLFYCLFFPYSFLALSLYVLTACSPADLADSRRQKTGWANGSAKADAADLADKDNYHIVEILLFMLFAVSLRPLRYLRENNMQEDSSYL